MHNKIIIYQIDAFTNKVFGGNPAAVCVLDTWLSDELMQNIAAENNLAETAFLVQRESDFDIRWFTPTVEVALCGHATLASAHVLFYHLNYPGDTLNFYSRQSGILSVSKAADLLTLNFPADLLTEIDPPHEVLQAFSQQPINVYKGKTDFMLLYATQADIENSNPDHSILKRSDARGIIITAPGKDVDFVSRFFAPGSGIDEDPVTGSAHTTLTPFWSKKLNKTVLSAKQLSARSGELSCTYLGDRVEISGKAVTYLVGEISV